MPGSGVIQKKMVYYSFWDLLTRDVHYPLQTDTYINGYYKETFLINHWELNPRVSVDSLIIPLVLYQISARGTSQLLTVMLRI